MKNIFHNRWFTPIVVTLIILLTVMFSPTIAYATTKYHFPIIFGEDITLDGGNIVCSGAETVDGRDLSSDGSKLDGIEAGADVTADHAGDIKLDDLGTPDDNTDLDSSITEHGLLPKLDNTATNFLNGQGAWAVPAGGGATSIHKGDDEIVNNSSVLQNDNAFQFAVLNGDIYLVETFILFTSGTTPDIKFHWSIPAGAVRWGVVTIWGGTSTKTEADDIIIAGLGTDTIVIVEFISLLLPSSDGTVYFQWAQNTANASDTTVQGASYMRYTKIHP